MEKRILKQAGVEVSTDEEDDGKVVSISKRKRDIEPDGTFGSSSQGFTMPKMTAVRGGFELLDDEDSVAQRKKRKLEKRKQEASEQNAISQKD